jgi:transposase-like protein
MHLIDVTKELATEEQCLAYIEKMRWPNGVRCATCGAKEVSAIARKSNGKNKRAQLYQCLEPTCKQQFTATSGTIFHDTHLPLNKWFMAIALIVDAKKGISAKQLERTLQINYRTAWHLSHRIRHAMQSEGGLLSGTVEIDEVYIGGKQRGNKGKYTNKDCVLGIRQRGGNLKLVKIPNRTQAEIEDAVLMHVDSSVERIITDDMASYKFSGTALHNAKHDRINHSRKVYVKGDIHTNTVESSFSLLRRAIIGSYHQLSIKHLQRYLDEFSYRYNRRDAKDIFEQTVTRLSSGTALPYKRLVAQT